MAAFWKRVIVVKYGGFVITAPKIGIEITYESDSTPTTGTVELFNLSKSTEEAIEKSGGSIVIEAGYENSKAIILNGTVQRIEKLREKMQRVVKLTVSSQAIAQERLGGEVNKTWAGEEKVRYIVSDIVKHSMKMEHGTLNAIPENAVVTNWSWSGSAHYALTNLVALWKLSVYEDANGVIQFNLPSKASESVSRSFRIDMTNGLVEAPAVTDDGVRIKSLLNANYEVGSVLDIKSEFVNGRYKVVSLKHTGDNWDGGFFTEMDTRSIEQ